MTLTTKEIVEQYSDFFKEPELEPTIRQKDCASRIEYFLKIPLPKKYTKEAYREYISKYKDQLDSELRMYRRLHKPKNTYYNSFNDEALEYFGWYDIY